MGRDRIRHFVSICVLPANPITEETGMAVSINQAGQNVLSGCIHNPGSGRDIDIFPNCHNFAAIHQDDTFFQRPPGDGQHLAIYNCNHGNLLQVRYISNTSITHIHAGNMHPPVQIPRAG